MAQEPVQLPLLELGARDWRLDDDTKRIGRAGVDAARRAIAESLRRAAA